MAQPIKISFAPKFMPGEQVRFVGGGPVMTVMDFIVLQHDDYAVRCAWFPSEEIDAALGKTAYGDEMQSEMYYPHLLERA